MSYVHAHLNEALFVHFENLVKTGLYGDNEAEVVAVAISRLAADAITAKIIPLTEPEEVIPPVFAERVGALVGEISRAAGDDVSASRWVSHRTEIITRASAILDWKTPETAAPCDCKATDPACGKPHCEGKELPF